MPDVEHLPSGPDWVAVTASPLPVAEILAWTVRPECGAVVTFCGTVRDHSEGRAGVVALEYEAYLDQVEPRLTDIARSARGRWPCVGRLALAHRVGRLLVGEVSVVVAVSTPHRAEAFEAGGFCIDSVKESVPIWKRETWADGSGWALCAHELVEVGDGRPAAGSGSPARPERSGRDRVGDGVTHDPGR